MQRYKLGEYIAIEFLDLDIAIVANQDVIDKMVEDTAVNRGASVFVTHDVEKAKEWLGS